MGGGGFMQHASDTNRKDRAQRTARRAKFQGNHSDKTLLDTDVSQKIDFSHLTREQIEQERKRIDHFFRAQRRKSFLIGTLAIAVVIVLFTFLYQFIF